MVYIKIDNPIRYSMVSYLGFEKAKEDAKFINSVGGRYSSPCRHAPHIMRMRICG